ncbi:hypothetical protein NDU88_005796 [Pleurodeles waltl]|uniref:Uncharacterized protein n=1 Tax=Pleurodeles waltl TaxID=8319 RepID=A0AAV7PHU8_PLEWA|nr:hypothetical protein NDU88_005796 [Pleurodeles waltl]
MGTSGWEPPSAYRDHRVKERRGGCSRSGAWLKDAERRAVNFKETPRAGERAGFGRDPGFFGGAEKLE